MSSRSEAESKDLKRKECESVGKYTKTEQLDPSTRLRSRSHDMTGDRYFKQQGTSKNFPKTVKR